MPFRVSGKNIAVGDALRERVNQRISEVAGKYFDGGFSGHVTISKEGFGFLRGTILHFELREPDGFWRAYLGEFCRFLQL